MKSFYLFFLLLFISCQNQDNQQNVVKEQLIKDFLQSKLALEIKNQQNKIYILKNNYCEKVDCESYFKGFEESIEMVPKETAFMRVMQGLNNTLIINKIDEQNGIIEAKKLSFIKIKNQR